MGIRTALSTDVRDGLRYSILYVFDYIPGVIRFNIVYLIENMETGEKYTEHESVTIIRLSELILSRFSTKHALLISTAAAVSISHRSRDCH